MAKKTQETKIKANLLLIIATNPLIKAKLCTRFERSHATITVWIDKNHPMLTTIDSLDIIASELELPVTELTENNN